MPLPDGEEGGRGEAAGDEGAGDEAREPLVEGLGSVCESRSSSERPEEDLLLKRERKALI